MILILLIKTIFTFFVNAEKTLFFAKLVFQDLYHSLYYLLLEYVLRVCCEYTLLLKLALFRRLYFVTKCGAIRKKLFRHGESFGHQHSPSSSMRVSTPLTMELASKPSLRFDN